MTKEYLSFIAENRNKENFEELALNKWVSILPKIITYIDCVTGKNLTNTELRIIEVIIKYDIITKEDLISEIWKYADDDNIVKVNISNIRRKGIPVEYVKGKGYKISKKSS